MKLGIMQPYFFPYLGYFELIARTDRWVVFDVVQYNARSWMNRNRILHPSEGWQYVSLPVMRMPLGTPIGDIRVKDPAAACARLLGQLDHYRKRAPFFSQVTDIVRATFARDYDSLVGLNVASLAEVCRYLEIGFTPSLCSRMDLDLDDVSHPGQWALRIASQLGATEYVNPPGGRDIFKPAEWQEAGIRLTFTQPLTFSYDCAPYAFVEGLSVLDVLMWNDPGAVRAFLTRAPGEGDAIG